MEVVSLFPTPIGIFEFDRKFTKKEIDFIKGQKLRTNIGNTTSEENYILNTDTLKNIKKFIEQSVKQYFEKIYSPLQDTSLRITQSWCNYTKPGQYHHKHAHPNSFVSGVFYIQANKETDKIYFYRNDWHQLRTPVKEYNIFNSESWWMEVYTGRMFLFPSQLTHMVEPVEGTDTRISLSFNTFPVGNFGDVRGLTGLEL